MHPHSLPSNSSHIHTWLFTHNSVGCFFKGTEFTGCCLYVHGCRTIYRSMASLSETSALKETDSICPRRHELPVMPQLGLGLISSSPIHGGILVGLILCRSWAYSHGHCEFTEATALPCLASTVSMQISTTPGSYNFSSPFSAMASKPWRKKL